MWQITKGCFVLIISPFVSQVLWVYVIQLLTVEIFLPKHIFWAPCVFTVMWLVRTLPWVHLISLLEKNMFSLNSWIVFQKYTLFWYFFFFFLLKALSLWGWGRIYDWMFLRYFQSFVFSIKIFAPFHFLSDKLWLDLTSKAWEKWFVNTVFFPA